MQYCSILAIYLLENTPLEALNENLDFVTSICIFFGDVNFNVNSKSLNSEQLEILALLFENGLVHAPNNTDIHSAKCHESDQTFMILSASLKSTCFLSPEHSVTIMPFY